MPWPAGGKRRHGHLAKGQMSALAGLWLQELGVGGPGTERALTRFLRYKLLKINGLGATTMDFKCYCMCTFFCDRQSHFPTVYLSS